MTTASVPSAERSARLNMRIAPTALDTIREAAAVQQQDVTSFVLGAAMERARSVLMEEQVLRLSPAEADRLEAALDKEAEIIPALAELFRYARSRQVGVGQYSLAAT